ncbi:tRNA 2-thiouridine(34) synthase MnmA [Geosporobacter ferrireducens]|uniref:tRNA-specific 2-thiouridylase MnmA n=1 Tax=Geosporobacter ferrireducens TaxID=1424294 RepID=A0A1D8GPY4_9FIRM|nr:tRNA 2-thiouridine(34) synthase MnmA [Geosporobacter ferrireducens]AOT72854.1 tRNA 2-thiouridine(34) synthase MnmA [Geosporobacter ferrireducens]MTI55255.1 tRNA 2-thiouridine(34) synthase MnmA [Geosporobacter ferrireducens]
MNLDKNKVVVGMSGGVDSSVAACILKKQGYNVIGVTMQVWPDIEEEYENSGGCCGLSAVDDARRVADQLQIPFYVMNFKDIFEKKVIQYFINDYKRGRTPNPCIACNKFIKFDELLRRANQLGAYYVATGHYAKIIYDIETHQYRIKKSKAAGKDQTYALYHFTQEQLAHTLMPLGDFETKDDVRKIASEMGFINAYKPDSQEICFVKNNDYGNFIEKNEPEAIEPGDFVDTAGRILGRHRGIVHYTIGQRKGLEIALGKRSYVTEIRPESNQVVLGENEDVFGIELMAEDVNFLYSQDFNKSIHVKAQIRYNAVASDAIVYPLEKNCIKVVFKNPQRAITPGQAVVFYQDDLLLGGGTITSKVR